MEKIVLKPEVIKAYEDFLKSFHADCMPPTITEPTTDAMREGLVTVFKIFERIKSVNYNKGEPRSRLKL